MISIITPAEKNEHLISDTLESIWKQTFTDFEALILHSDIEAVKRMVGEKYLKDTRFRFIGTPEDMTVGKVRNMAIDMAEGTHIFFLDSDDYISEGTLKLLYDNLEDHPLVRGRMKRTDFGSSFAVIFPGVNKISMFTLRKYNLIRNHSALNFLVSKAHIEHLDLHFNEAVEIYSDLTFMIPLLESVEAVPYVSEAIYFRRRRNDPINRPSLRQLPVEKRMQDLFTVYNALKDMPLSLGAETFLDNILLNFYRKYLIVKFEDDAYIDKYFDDLAVSINKINQASLKNRDRILLNDIWAIRTNKVSIFKRLNRFHHLLRDLRKGLQGKRGRKELIYKRIFNKLGLLDDHVVFESFQGKAYSDSPKYIYEYMLKKRSGHKFVWVLNKNEKIPGNPKTVKRFSLKYYYHIARAKYIVSNVRMPNSYIKRRGQKYLQTWHGTPLKRLAGDMESVHMPGTNVVRYKRNFSNETDKWDYLIAPNPYSSEIFRRAFWFNNTMLETGYPRNDILTNDNNPVIIQSIKENLNLPKGKKVILYAPTWRDDEYYGVGKYKFSLRLDLERLKAQFGDEYIVLLRMHYVVASKMDLTGLEGFAYDVSGYDDVSELYLISDMLITDYSSVFFDYANLKRPILFFTYDLEKYKDQLRGFYIDMETELPGPLLRSNDELFEAMENIGQVTADYRERYDAFYDRFCLWDDGSAAEKVVDAVFDE